MSKRPTFSRSCDISGSTILTPYKTTSAAETGRLVACPCSCGRKTSSKTVRVRVNILSQAFYGEKVPALLI